jgi:hypothetical protein
MHATILGVPIEHVRHPAIAYPLEYRPMQKLLTTTTLAQKSQCKTQNTKDNKETQKGKTALMSSFQTGGR